MAKIYIRGHQHPQTVSAQIARKVDDIKKDESIENGYYISLDGFSCDKGDVRSVVIFDVDDDRSSSRENKMDENGEKIAKYNRDFVSEVLSYANGNLEKKLKFNLEVAKMYCYAITGKDIEEYKPSLKPIFIEELKTQRLIVNPTKYIKLFNVEELEGSSGLTKINYLVRKTPLKLMENYLHEVNNVLR